MEKIVYINSGTLGCLTVHIGDESSHLTCPIVGAVGTGVWAEALTQQFGPSVSTALGGWDEDLEEVSWRATAPAGAVEEFLRELFPPPSYQWEVYVKQV